MSDPAFFVFYTLVLGAGMSCQAIWGGSLHRNTGLAKSILGQTLVILGQRFVLYTPCQVILLFLYGKLETS